MSEQKIEDKIKMYQDWQRIFQYSICPNYHDCVENQEILSRYISAHCEGFWNFDTVTAAVKDNKHRLQLKTSEMVAAEKKAQAEAAAAQARSAALTATIKKWLNDSCPLGLLTKDGVLDPDDARRISLFVERNYEGVFNAESLNAAITILDNLTWFDKSFEATQIRNVPPPPPRKLSEQAAQDAGLKPVRNFGTHQNDGKMLKSMSQVARDMLEIQRRRLGLSSESETWENRANAISVNHPTGKFNHPETAAIRKRFSYKPDRSTIDWKATYELRDRLATEYEKNKNRR